MFTNEYLVGQISNQVQRERVAEAQKARLIHKLIAGRHAPRGK